MRRALLAALACALLPATAAAQEQALGRLEVDEIHITGNTAFPTDTLERAIVNRETDCRAWVLSPLCAFGVGLAEFPHYFHEADFAADAIRLRLYYWQRGYREAQVDTARALNEDGEIELTFTITEGRPVLVDSIAVVGGEGIEDQGLLEDLPLEKGDPLSGIEVEATRDLLEHRLHDAGYAYALVLLRTDLPQGSYSAGVTFDVDPGPRVRFGPIEVVGNTELEDVVVRRMLGFREGDVYGTTKLLDAQRNLFSLELVSYARVDTIPGGQLDTIIPLRVEITEGYEYRVRAGLGWNTAECLSADARWTARNVGGGARRLQLRGRVANVLAESLQNPFCRQAGTGDYGRLNWLLGADFTQPWIFSPRNSLSLGLYGERTSLKDVFVREAFGVNVVLVRSLARATPLSLSYRPQLSELSAAEVFFCSSFLACAPEDIEVLQGRNWLSPVGANLSTDQSDNLLNPRSGVRGAVDLEHASAYTGSDFAYNRAVAEGSVYQGFGAVTGAGRIRLGWVGPGRFDLLARGNVDVVHPQKRFFAGGSNSVRGYAQSRLGPKILSIGLSQLLEPRGDGEDALPPVCTIAQINDLTCDASPLDDGTFDPRPTGGTRLVEGNVEARFPITAELFEGVAFLDFGQVWGEGQPLRLSDVAWTPGLGIRWYSVIGPIRLDVGYRPPRDENLQVVTSQVREKACAGEDTPPCYERTGALALLQPRVSFDEENPGDGWFNRVLSRLQVHFSIGQAF